MTKNRTVFSLVLAKKMRIDGENLVKLLDYVL